MNKSIYLGSLALIEGVAIFLSYYVGLYLRFLGDLGYAAASVGDPLVRALIYTSVLMLAMLAVGLYRQHQRPSGSEALVRIVAAIGLAGLGDATVYYLVPAVMTDRGSLAVSLIAAMLAILLLRMFWFAVVGHERFRRNVLVVGNGRVAAALNEICRTIGRGSFRIAGFLSMPGDSEASSGHRVVSSASSLLGLVREHKIDEIVVALDDRRACFPSRELLDCRYEGVKVTEMLTFLEKETGKIDLDTLCPSWLIYGRGFRQGSFHRLIKRSFDIVASLLVLIVFLPMVLLAVLAILIESGGRGGIVYRQKRVGLNGEPFELIKLRSMVPEAEADGRPRWAAKADPRVTYVGALLRRLRIDELPQLVNILRGEMSFVGPRPERPEFVDELALQIPFYGERHCMKPGLTGWAQLNYPYGSSVADAKQKLQYDLYYIKNYSLALDLLILVQTLEAVLWRRERAPGSARQAADVDREPSVTLSPGR